MSVIEKTKSAAISTREHLDELRKKIVSKQLEATRTRSAFVPVPEAVERFTAYLDRTAKDAAFDTNVIGFLRTEQNTPTSLFGEGPKQIDGALAVLFRDELITKFRESAEAQETGLPLGERYAAIERIEGELLELERAEEQLIEQMEELGLPVERREDARPEIILDWKD